MKKTKAQTAKGRATKKTESRAAAPRQKTKKHLDPQRLEGRLRRALATVSITHTLTSPLLQAVESLLRLAAEVVGSEEASVITRDENRHGLRFLAATGEFAERLKKMHIPPGKGIAGFVFTTGQPMAVADVKQEESFYAGVDQETGHSTQTMIATPLRVGEETIGVLEFVNRIGPPPYAPFSPEDMDKAAGFADTIALLVDAHEKATLTESLFERAVLNALDPAAQDLSQWLGRLKAAPENRELISLALALREVALLGEEERQLCHEILTALGRWSQLRAAGAQKFLTI